MERINDYKSFSQNNASKIALALSEEKSVLQKEYQEYFMSMLHKYDISSVSELEDEVKEMLSLHQEAQQMALGAKRQAVIHDLAVANLASMIEKRLTETEE